MTYHMGFFQEGDLARIYGAFREAFTDYVVDTTRTTETIFSNRMIKNGVDLSLSVGAYDQGKLVGFTIVALDQYCGVNAAYDAVTGIIKPYRGLGLAKKMFEHLLPKLKAKGVERFYLEVIQSNKAAVRAYKKAGFSIVRELDCYKIPFEAIPQISMADGTIRFQLIEKDEIFPVSNFFDWEPSFENSVSSIQRIPDGVLILGAYHHDKLVGCLVYYPLLGWILNMAIHKEYRRQKIGSTLLVNLKDQIGKHESSAEIINVDHADKGMLAFLETLGAEFCVNQFEMKLNL